MLNYNVYLDLNFFNYAEIFDILFIYLNNHKTIYVSYFKLSFSKEYVHTPKRLSQLKLGKQKDVMNVRTVGHYNRTYT